VEDDLQPRQAFFSVSIGVDGIICHLLRRMFLAGDDARCRPLRRCSGKTPAPSPATKRPLMEVSRLVFGDDLGAEELDLRRIDERSNRRDTGDDKV